MRKEKERRSQNGDIDINSKRQRLGLGFGGLSKRKGQKGGEQEGAAVGNSARRQATAGGDSGRCLRAETHRMTVRLQELDAALQSLGIDRHTRGVLCNGDAAVRWGKTNLQDLQDLRAHFNDKQGDTTLRKRKRYEDAEASEEDESGNVVRQLNIEDIDADDGIESLQTSQDNIISQLSKTCTLYASNTSQSARKKARKHLKTVCEILEEVCEEAEEHEVQADDSAEDGSSVEEASESGKEDEGEGFRNDGITSPISGRNLFDDSSSDSEEDSLPQHDIPGQDVQTRSSVEEQMYWQGTEWDIVMHTEA